MQYYLVCLGLVAGAKTSSTVDAWLLAYVYYLKAIAELTFLHARKQGIRLKEDFSQEDANSYDTEFFTRKATTSLDKCLVHLQRAGEEAGCLATAAHELKDQII